MEGFCLNFSGKGNFSRRFWRFASFGWNSNETPSHLILYYPRTSSRSRLVWVFMKEHYKEFLLKFSPKNHYGRLLNRTFSFEDLLWHTIYIDWISWYLFREETKTGKPNSACSTAFIKQVFPKFVNPPFGLRLFDVEVDFSLLSDFWTFDLSFDFRRFDWMIGEGGLSSESLFSAFSGLSLRSSSIC